MVALLAAAVLPACENGGTGPEPTIVDIEINGAPTSALAVGDTARLTTTVANSEGQLVDGAAVTWSSTEPGVATVPTPGVVVGQGDGTAKIVAAAGGVADTIEVTVTAIIGGCPASGLTLPVGAIRRLTAVDPIACPAGGATGAEYVLVAFNGAEAGSLNLGVQVSGLALNRIADRGLYGSRSSAPASMAPAGPTRDVAFDERIRRWERSSFSRYAPAARAMRDRTARGGPSFSRSAAVPMVGDTFRVNTRTDDNPGTTDFEPCTQPRYTLGRVMAVTQRAIVVADTANPDGGFTAEDYQHIGVTFDTLVYPVDVRNFGEPGDVDVNERVLIFYSSAVNQLTERGSGSYVGGFFFSRDLFPRDNDGSLAGCPGSNLSEMFYMLVPDPGGEFSDPRTKDFVLGQTLATVAHEFQHLINASRRLYVTNAFEFEDTWLNEGLSHIAEELIFYEATGLAPEQNLTLPLISTTQQRRSLFIEYMLGNLGRLWDYLEEPHRNSPYGDNDELGTRGAAWAFLRYAADRSPKSDPELWQGLVDANATGLANLRAVLGTDPIPWVRDWSVSMYTDDFIPGLPPRFTQPSWDFRSSNRVYNIFRQPPHLEVVPLTNGSSNRSIVAGGASYFSIPVQAAGRAEVHLTAGGAALPSSVSVFLVRVK